MTQVADETSETQSRESRPTSRLPGFFKKDLPDRVQSLLDQGIISQEDAALLLSENPCLPSHIANNMIENVIGTYGLPVGLATNFVINDREVLVPMVVEEPSIVAAVSHSARLVRASGGFKVECDPSIMIGQVQIVGCHDLDGARDAVLSHKEEILKRANALHPNLVRRGGGARDLEVRLFQEPELPGVPSCYTKMLVVHILVDTCDAMGANLINTMAEGIAPRLEELTGGRAHLRILSNLADRRVVRAECRIPISALAQRSFSGREVAEGIVGASRFAEVDPYRAATHNKGIMNGIDAVALASGNDWRAIEAGAHAYACRDGAYRPMAIWRIEDEALVGRLEVPLQIGTVGGPIRMHPVLAVLYKVFGLSTARELGAVMGAVGLAQNLGAVKALATDGIQRGHMALHARSVAVTAGARGTTVEMVAQKMIQSGEVKVHRAQEILQQIEEGSIES